MANALWQWLLQVPLLCFLVGLASGDTGQLASANGVYNSSTTPDNLPWNTYNYCNAPHVNAKHYRKPSNVSDANLVYINAVIRHHKVRERLDRNPCLSNKHIVPIQLPCHTEHMDELVVPMNIVRASGY